jgi:hypothetical protein
VTLLRNAGSIPREKARMLNGYFVGSVFSGRLTIPWRNGAPVDRSDGSFRLVFMINSMPGASPNAPLTVTQPGFVGRLN